MPLSTQPFSLDQIPMARRRQAWAEQLSKLALLPNAEASDTTGVGQFCTSRSGAVLATLGGAQQHLSGLTHLSDGRFRLTLVRKGRASLRTPGHLLHLADGDLVLQDNSVFELDLPGDWELIVLLLPMTPLLSRLGRNKVDYPVALGSSVAAIAARSVLRVLGTNLDTLEHTDFSAAEIALVELLASAILCTIKAPEGDRLLIFVGSRWPSIDVWPRSICILRILPAKRACPRAISKDCSPAAARAFRSISRRSDSNIAVSICWILTMRPKAFLRSGNVGGFATKLISADHLQRRSLPRQAQCVD